MRLFYSTEQNQGDDEMRNTEREDGQMMGVLGLTAAFILDRDLRTVLVVLHDLDHGIRDQLEKETTIINSLRSTELERARRSSARACVRGIRLQAQIDST